MSDSVAGSGTYRTGNESKPFCVTHMTTMLWNRPACWSHVREVANGRITHACVPVPLRAVWGDCPDCGGHCVIPVPCDFAGCSGGCGMDAHADQCPSCRGTGRRLLALLAEDDDGELLVDVIDVETGSMVGSSGFRGPATYRGPVAIVPLSEKEA